MLRKLRFSVNFFLINGWNGSRAVKNEIILEAAEGEGREKEVTEHKVDSICIERVRFTTADSISISIGILAWWMLSCLKNPFLLNLPYSTFNKGYKTSLIPLPHYPCLILRLSYLLQDDRSDENKREGAAIESGLRWLEDRSNSMIGIADLIEITSQ